MNTKILRVLARTSWVAGVILAGCVIAPDPTPLQPVNLTKVDFSTDRVTVDARAGWVQTGIEVKAGQKIRFSATGTWGESPDVNRSADGGPAGIFGSGYWGVQRPLAYAQWGALLGRVGSSIFLIGVENTVTIPQDGDLLLGINDNSENVHHGVLTVTIARQ